MLCTSPITVPGAPEKCNIAFSAFITQDLSGWMKMEFIRRKILFFILLLLG